MPCYSTTALQTHSVFNYSTLPGLFIILHSISQTTLITWYLSLLHVNHFHILRLSQGHVNITSSHGPSTLHQCCRHVSLSVVTDVLCLTNVCIIFTQTRLRYVWVLAITKSVCHLQHLCALLGVKIFRNISRHFVPEPSFDLGAKFYGNCPRGTPSPGALNARGVAK